MIYVDNAATTKMSPAAISAMMPYLDQIYGNPSSIHSAGQQAAKALLQARQTIAQNLNCSPKELTFTSGGTESDNQAIISIAQMGKRMHKKHIISSAIEHHAVLRTLEELKKEDFEITLLPVYENGIIHLQDLEAAIRPDTILVTIMYANNEIGTIQPIAELGAICRKHQVLFHTDAVAAAGYLPIDVERDQIDLLSLSSHKFHGPKGIGVLYARKGIPLKSLLWGGEQERGKRAGTQNVPAIVGMATALQESCRHMKENEAKMLFLRNRLTQGLLRISGTHLHGDAQNRLCGNVNIGFEQVEAETLLLLLDQAGICASAGSACASGSLNPSHVLLALGCSKEQAKGSVRFSLSQENTLEEIDTIIQVTTQAVSRLRSDN